MFIIICICQIMLHHNIDHDLCCIISFIFIAVSTFKID